MALNESTMWSGEYDPDQEIAFGRERLDALRQLYFEGNIVEGHRIAHDSLRGRKHSFGTHLPIGELKLDFLFDGQDDTKSYRRSLNLEEAVATVSFERGGVRYFREYFSSNPQGVLVMRLTADKRKAISFVISMEMKRNEAAICTEEDRLTFEGQALFPMHGTGGVHYYGCIAVVTQGGTIKQMPQGLCIEEADAATLVVDVRTNYNIEDCEKPINDYQNICRRSVDCALAREYADMRSEHIADYAALFSRVKLQLGKEKSSKLTTDARWHSLKQGNEDIGLQALFFQYGRYLLIASSRENSPLPVALQVYDYICKILDMLVTCEECSLGAIREAIVNVTSDYAETVENARERLINALEIIVVAYCATLIKKHADDKLEALFNDNQKPIAKAKYSKKTDTDLIIGRRVKVIEPISNRDETGTVKVNGQEWSARLVDTNGRAESGETVIVLSINGVKLICKKV